MEYYENILCISHTELVNGIMADYTIKNLRRARKIDQVRRGCNGTPALFSVDSLPLKYKTEVYKRYPDFEEQAQSKPFLENIVPDGNAIDNYAGYVLPNGRNLDPEKQAEYANDCAIMNAFRDRIMKSNSHRARQSKPRLKQGEFWKRAAAALPRIGEEWPNGLPQNARSLQRKYQAYMRDGWTCFISGKFQNMNAAKVDDDIKESYLTQLMAHHNNLDNTRIAGLYNTVARQKGWPEITAGTVRVWKKKLNLVTLGGRLGESRFRNSISMQVVRSKPTAPFLMWSLDGWDVELLYQDCVIDKKGHRNPTFCNRLTVEVVMDPCCGYPIGYAIGKNEDSNLIMAALRDAVRHSEELFGVKYRANQVQSDHFCLKTMTNLYQAVSDKVTPAKVKNAKAKPVERYFAELNKKYCQLCNNWSGYGVTTDPKRQPNNEALNRRRRSFPDKEGVIRQIMEIMALERKQKIGRLREMMENLPQKRRLPMTRENYLQYFGDETGFRNTFEGGGLKVTLLGVKRQYDSFDISFRNHTSEKWTVKYDPANLGEVLAVNEDGTLRYMLREKHVQPMALADRKPGDAEKLQEVFDFNKALEQHVIGKLEHTAEKTEELLRSLPRQDSILNRLLIVDGRGQHKLPKARARLGKAIDADAVEIPILPQGAHESDKDDYSIF